jgi:hypothetical protein
MTDRRLIILLAVYFCLATAYNLANPLFESPDERLHYEFIHYIQTHGQLPVVDLSAPGTEYHQPPAYYVVAAVLTYLLPVDNLESHERINPFWGYDIQAVGRDNKNQFLHGPAQEFPYDQTARAVHLTRALSTLFGVGALLFTYRLSRLFGSDDLALAATAVVAFTPNFLLTTSSVTNDAPLVFLSTWAGFIMTRLLSRDEVPTWRDWAGLGILLGLGMLTKLSAWPLLPVSALTVSILAIRHRSPHLFLVAGLTLLVGVGLIGGWWLVRNLQLYGDPTGLESMWEVWGERPPLNVATYIIELRAFRGTFWANFGYGNVPVPMWVYTLCDLFVVAGAGGLVWRLLHKRKWPSVRALVLLAWVVLTLVALAWYFQRTWAVTGRQLYAVLPVVALGLVSGLSAFIPPRWQSHLPIAITSIMLVFGADSLVGVLIPAYRPSPRLSPVEAEQAVTHRLDWQFGDVARLVGYDADPEMASPGKTVRVTLFWEPLRSSDNNYAVFVQLYGENGSRVGARDTYPGLGNDPTCYWESGYIIADTIPVPIAPEAEGPVALEIVAGLYDLDTGERLPITDPAGMAIDYPVIGWIKLAQTGPYPVSDHPQEAHFTGGVALVGYDLSSQVVAPGEFLTLTLYWEPGGPLSADYTVFVHLVDAEGDILAQGDGPPREGRYPTTLWGADERFSDAHTILLPDTIDDGAYTLLVGLYSPEDGARLPLEAGGDTVRLDLAVYVR